MTVTLKRKRFAQSYKEPSSDEDVESDAPATRTKRAGLSRRASRQTRLPSVEAEPESRSRARRHNNTSERVSDSVATGRRVLRQDKRRVSYRESSGDDVDDQDFEVEEQVVEQAPRRRVAPSSQAHKNKEPRKNVRSTGSRVQKALDAQLKPTASTEAASIKIATDGRTPAWASLPYQVLLQVFVYASHPLHDENMSPTPSISWLVKVACMCSAFTKPALTALYRTPPIYALNHHRRRDVVQHLTNPPAEAYAAYQVMVKRLGLDATKMSSSTDPLFDAANISALISSLTTVKEIDIFDPLDRPPYRPRLKRVRRWNYPDELFAAIRQSKLLLKSWRWNSGFCAQGPLWIKEIHGDRAFQSLRELTLTKFDPDEKRKPDDSTPTTEELVGSALAVLPNLASLAFESCKVVNGKLLSLLPSTLISLEISNCINVFSDDLRAFLLDHGNHLEDLVLNHNQCLAISFLTDLKRSCPRLETLRMDLNYYSSLALSSDNEPLYDWSLELDEIPTWPSTLRVLDMDYLRNWSSDAATNFFASLIDSADELPDLRELRISAIVDIGWRQRADYRRKWASMFQTVFASRSSAPSPHLVSLRAFREWKASQGEGTEKNDSLLDVVAEVKTDEAKRPGVQQDQAVDSDSDAPLVSKRKERWNSQRLRTRGKASNYEESSDTDTESEIGSDADDEPKHIQGKCHTVVFKLDNSRPREAVFDEGDFLDDELSGDEDWDGNDIVEDGYAW